MRAGPWPDELILLSAAELTTGILLRLASVDVQADWWIAPWRQRIDAYRNDLYALVDWMSRPAAAAAGAGARTRAAAAAAAAAGGCGVHFDVIENDVADYIAVGLRRHLLDRRDQIGADAEARQQQQQLEQQ